MTEIGKNGDLYAEVSILKTILTDIGKFGDFYIGAYIMRTILNAFKIHRLEI